MYFVYINLHERTEKNDHMNNLLKSLDLNFDRFEGIVPNLQDICKMDKLSKKIKDFLSNNIQIPRGIGVVGCYLSHINVLEKYKDINNEYLCIMEDDIDFNKESLDKIHNNIQFLNKTKKNWDILRTLWDRIPSEFEGLNEIETYENKIYKFNSPNYFSVYKTINCNRISGGCHFYIINMKHIEKILHFLHCEDIFNIDSVYSTNKLDVYAVLNRDVNISIPMKYRKQTNIPKV